MKLPDYYSYTAVLIQEDDGWLVEFPDIERCATNADTIEGAIIQAHNILEDYLAILERDDKEMPSATPYEDIEVPDGMKQRIIVPMAEARMRWRNETVKRVVILPAWLERKAVEAGYDFSNVLKSALLRRIRVVKKQVSNG